MGFIHIILNSSHNVITFSITVSRPLFIEEHGLRLLLDQEGVGVELSRQSYEAGDWATAVSEAWIKGIDAKNRKQYDMQNAIGIDKREKDGRKLAGSVIDWIRGRWNIDTGNMVLSETILDTDNNGVC